LIEIQETVDSAVHEQPDDVRTSMLPFRDLRLTVRDRGSIEYEHVVAGGSGVGGGAGVGPGAGTGVGDGAGGAGAGGAGAAENAACVTVTAMPAIVIWAPRDVPVLASTTKSIVLLPLPLGVCTRTQGCGLAAVHPHPEATDTRIGTRPPAAATFTARALSSYRQGAGSCRMLSR
jgi:hypothetical protein